MRYKRALLTIATLLLSTVGQASYAGNPVKGNKLNGAFIQFDDDSLLLSADDWTKMIEHMQKNGLRTLVIQWASHDVWDRESIPHKFTKNVDFTAPKSDLVEKLLAIADTRGIKVKVGAYFSDLWWDEEESLFMNARGYAQEKADYVQAIKDRDDAIATQKSPARIAELTQWVENHKNGVEQAQKQFEQLQSEHWTANNNNWLQKSIDTISSVTAKYKNHTSFAGIYLPQEIPNRKYNGDATKVLSQAFKAIVDSNKTEPAREMMFSCYRAEDLAEPASPAETTEFYGTFIRNTGLKSMAPQDSVGLNHWNTKIQIQQNAIPFLAACKDACSASGAEITPIPECWIQLSANDRRACAIERLVDQLELESQLFPDGVMVAFDLNHYLTEKGKKEAQDLLKAVDKLHASP